MQVIPLVLGLLVAMAIAPGVQRALVERGWVRENYRGDSLAFPFGIVIAAAAVISLVPLALLDELAGVDVYPDGLKDVAIYAFGMCLLGVIDDVFAGESRGWRGHGAALFSGTFTTGVLKAVGAVGLALLALSGEGYSGWNFLLAACVVVVATNLFNLLDLRPGRSWKGFILLGVATGLVTWDAAPLEAVGLFAGPILLVGLYDVRERAMLGDTGSNLIGAIAGFWLVLALSTTGQLIALAIMVVITLYGEFFSISRLVERTPILRHLDSLGRPA